MAERRAQYCLHAAVITHPSHWGLRAGDAPCMQEETYTAQDAETMELPDSADRPKLDDPFFKLEHGVCLKTFD